LSLATLWRYLSDGVVPEGAQLKRVRDRQLRNLELSAAQ